MHHHKNNLDWERGHPACACLKRKLVGNLRVARVRLKRKRAGRMPALPICAPNLTIFVAGYY